MAVSNTAISSLETSPTEIYILDAPGISGMGSHSFERYKRHIENGGKDWHNARLHVDGSIEFCDPQGMGPCQQQK